MICGLFKKKKTVHEQMLEIVEEVAQENEERRIKDLLISISAAASSEHDYWISITNTGRRNYRNLNIIYKDILLDAESFGVDTTHMPSDMARISGEPLLIEDLNPGQTIQLVRGGYGSHDRYDGSRNGIVYLEYDYGNKRVRREDRSWCYALVDLPNARSD